MLTKSAFDAFVDSTESTRESTFKRLDAAVHEQGMRYPCVILHSDTVQKGKLQVLRGLVTKGVSAAEKNDYYALYMNMGGKLLYLGRIAKSGVSVLLNSQLYSDFVKTAYTETGELVEGNRVYAFLAL